MKKIVGFYGANNKWTHDHSLAILNNNKIDKFIQLERITRRKYDNRMPNYLNSILTNENIELDEINLGFANTFALDSAAFFKVSENNIKSENGEVEFLKDGNSNLEPLKVTGKILSKSIEATIVPHEIAHLFSSIPFYGNFQDNSLLIHVDGAASLCNASAWLYNNKSLELLEQTIDFHNALMNFSYNDLTFDILNLERSQHLSMPGKLMGFASYGKSSKSLMNWLDSRDFFKEYIHNSQALYIKEAQRRFQYNQEKIIQNHKFTFNVAACIQKYFENKIFNFIKKHQELTGSKVLYYSGGAALNIKLNTKLVNSCIFNKIIIPPPASDSGLALGVVSYLNWKKNNGLKKSGPFLNNLLLEEEKYDPLYSIDEICKEISNGSVIGIWYGFGEAGPRALGHRSILGNPCIKNMKKRISMDIKKREWYRPLAPIVLKSEMEELFENYYYSEISKYMLYDFQVKRSKIDKIPTVTHIDNSSRAQIVQENDPDLKPIIDILETLRDRFNIPCLINTSFNKAGEPIVHTKKDAIESAKNLGLNGLIINNEFIKLRNL